MVVSNGSRRGYNATPVWYFDWELGRMFYKYRCLHTFEVREIQAIVPPYVTTYDEIDVRSVGGRELVKGKRRREEAATSPRLHVAFRSLLHS